MSDNVKALGPLYCTTYLPLRRFPLDIARTREYEHPWRSGIGIAVMYPSLVIMRGGDGCLWFRFRRRMFAVGLWKSSRKRKRQDDQINLKWALAGKDHEADSDEISVWTRPLSDEEMMASC